MRSLQDKVAVVTGGARGIGLATVEALLAAGMRVVLADKDEWALREEVELITAPGSGMEGRLVGVVCDVGSQSSVDALRDEAIRQFGSVQVIVNNAGVIRNGPAWEQSISDWEWLFRVNVWGVVHMVHSFVPAFLKAEEGHVVNIASVSGLAPVPSLSSYAASKAAVIAFSEVLYQDLQAAKSNVGVSVICPGFVQTELPQSQRERPDARGDEDLQSPFLEYLMERGLSAEDVADAVVKSIRENRFLVSPTSYRDKVAVERLRVLQENRNPEPITFDYLRQFTKDAALD